MMEAVRKQGAKVNSDDEIISDETFATMLDSLDTDADDKAVSELLEAMNENRIISREEAEQILAVEGPNKVVKCGLPEHVRPSDPENTTDVEECISRLHKNDPKLVEINLNNMKRTPIPVIQRLVMALKDNVHLKRLMLANTALSDTGAEPLIEAIQSNTTLETLNIETNFLSGDFLARLFNAALTNQTIREIKAVNQSPTFSTEAEMEIMRAVNTNKGLTKVSVNLRHPEAKNKVEQACLRNGEFRRQQRRLEQLQKSREVEQQTKAAQEPPPPPEPEPKKQPQPSSKSSSLVKSDEPSAIKITTKVPPKTAVNDAKKESPTTPTTKPEKSLAKKPESPSKEPETKPLPAWQARRAAATAAAAAAKAAKTAANAEKQQPPPPSSSSSTPEPKTDALLRKKETTTKEKPVTDAIVGDDKKTENGVNEKQKSVIDTDQQQQKSVEKPSATSTTLSTKSAEKSIDKRDRSVEKPATTTAPSATSATSAAAKRDKSAEKPAKPADEPEKPTETKPEEKLSKKTEKPKAEPIKSIDQHQPFASSVNKPLSARPSSLNLYPKEPVPTSKGLGAATFGSDKPPTPKSDAKNKPETSRRSSVSKPLVTPKSESAGKNWTGASVKSMASKFGDMKTDGSDSKTKTYGYGGISKKRDSIK